MRDKDDRNSFFPHIFDDIEKYIRFIQRQRSGGLIHNNKFRIPGDCFHDLHDLLVGNSEISHPRIDIHLDSHLITEFLCHFLHFLYIAHAKFLYFPPEKYILRHCQIWNQAEFLIDNRDSQIHSQLRIQPVILVSVKSYFTFRRLMRSCQKFDKG